MANDRDRDPSSPASEDQHDAGRRGAVRTITVGGTTVVVAGWSKPLIESIVLPAHAQATGGIQGGSSLTNVTFP